MIPPTQPATGGGQGGPRGVPTGWPRGQEPPSCHLAGPRSQRCWGRGAEHQPQPCSPRFSWWGESSRGSNVPADGHQEERPRGGHPKFGVLSPAGAGGGHGLGNLEAEISCGGNKNNNQKNVPPFLPCVGAIPVPTGSPVGGMGTLVPPPQPLPLLQSSKTAAKEGKEKNTKPSAPWS